MKIRQALSFAVGALVIAGGVRLVLDNRQQARELASLRRDVGNLEGQGEEGDRRQRLTPILVPVAAAPAPAAPAAPAADVEPTGAVPQAYLVTSPEAEAKHHAAVHQKLEAAFLGAPPDEDFAKRARSLADQKVPALLPEGSSARTMECRGDLCRLETSHKDRASVQKFVERAFFDPSGRLWNGATYSTPLHDDPEDGQMVTFIAREGQSLPDMNL